MILVSKVSGDLAQLNLEVVFFFLSAGFRLPLLSKAYIILSRKSNLRPVNGNPICLQMSVSSSFDQYHWLNWVPVVNVFQLGREYHMFEVAYKIDHMPSIAASIADLMQVPVESHKFGVANEIMVGSLEFYRLEEGLSIQISKFEPNMVFKVKRDGSYFENLFILDFHLTGVAKLNVTDQRIISNHHNGLVHGAYFASAGVESHAIFPPGFYNEEFHIVMDKSWLKDFFQSEVQNVFEKLELAAPFFMFERLRSKLSALLLQIFKSNPNQEFRKSFLHGKTLELLSLFFAQLKNRGENLEFGVSNYNDVSRLFDLMTFVDEHLGEVLNLNLLTKKVGFSECKLQKLSRAVLGKSIFQENTESRMLTALEVLGERRHSISEIGHMVGYNNMSHFSRAFKKVNGFLPSDYLKTLP